MLKLPALLRKSPPASAAPRDRDVRLRSGFERAPLGIAYVGVDGAWLQFNERFCEIVGYTREQLARFGFNDITHPDDARQEAVLLLRLRAGDVGRYRIEKRIVERRGKSRDVVVTATLVRDAGGEPDFFVYLVDEAPARGAAKTQARDSEVVGIIEKMAQVAVIRTDEKGAITGWNAGAERILGYRREEMLGRPRRLLFRDRDNWEGQSTKQISAAGDGGPIELEDWRVTRDGRHIWVRSSMARVERGFVEIIGEPGGRDGGIGEQARATAEVRGQELKRTIEELRAELERRERVEDSLRTAVEDMRVVGEETMNELRIMTNALRQEIERRKAAEEEVRVLKARPPAVAVVQEEIVPITELPPRAWKKLGATPPAELLIAHGSDARTGTLVIASGRREVEIFFEKGKVFSVSSNDPSRFLTERLIALGIISQEQRQKALEIQRETHLALGRILMIVGAVGEEQLIDVMRAKADEEIADVLTWRGAKYAFVEGDIPALQLVPLRIDVAELVVQRLQRGAAEGDLSHIAEEFEDEIEIPPPPPPPPLPTELLVASPVARKFHRLSCGAARRLDEETRIMFTSVAEATAAGYASCRLCGPILSPRA